MTRRHAPLVRCIRLMRLLEGRRHRPTMTDLALELGVNPRTVKRYIAALEEAHYPVPPPQRDLFGAEGS